MHFIKPHSDYYGGNDRVKQLRRRLEWYEIG